jgi:hypothetical protein
MRVSKIVSKNLVDRQKTLPAAGIEPATSSLGTWHAGVCKWLSELHFLSAGAA